MQPRKLNVLFVFYSYAGNSTGTSEISALRQWFVPLIVKLKTDPWYLERIGTIDEQTIADTPITMSRNQSVVLARECGADVLVMVDSDMVPDVHLKSDPHAQPFFESSFKFLYEHFDKGPAVIAAPYGGCPPHENMFVFCWDTLMNAGDETRFVLRQYERDEARKMAGIQHAAALPTGLIMYDVRAFELIEPSSKPKSETLDDLLCGKITKAQALHAMQDGWFHYEWHDQRAHKKASTEDVQNTRDISLAGQAVLGFNPVYCNWDAWAGHNKVWTVGKPQKYTTENISTSFQQAVQNKDSIQERIVEFNTVLPENNGSGRVLHAKDEMAASLPPEIRQRLNHSDYSGERLVSYKYMTGFEEHDAIAKLVRAESARLGRKLNVIEVGSYVGESAVTMARTECCEHILCVDNFASITPEWQAEIGAAIGGPDTLRKLFLKNTRRHECIHLEEGLSADVASRVELAKLFRDGIGKADLIFIDADHSYESVYADIVAWFPHLEQGGVIFGHDYHAQDFPGVAQAVHDAFGDDAKPLGEGVAAHFWIVRSGEVKDHRANGKCSGVAG